MAQELNILKEFGAVKIKDGGILRLGDEDDGLEMSFDGTSTVTFEAATANDEIAIGTNTATDFRLNGATAGRDALWDASANSLIFADNASIRLGDAGDGVVLAFDGTSTLDIDAANANDEIAIGGTVATDFRLNGATAGRDALWDASADSLILADAASIRFGDAGDGVVFAFDGADTLNIDPANANDIVRIGETTQADFQVDGATDLLWDASAGSLANGGMIAAFIPNAEFNTDSSNGGAISVTSPYTLLSTGGAETRTLPDGTVIGQIKKLTMSVDGGDCVVTITTSAGGASRSVITFSELGQSVELMWVSTGWRITGVSGGDTTVDTLPAIAAP